MATPPVKKNNNAMYMKGCVGCLVIVFLFVCFVAAVGGYLFYKEETGLDDHSDEVLTAKVVNRSVSLKLTPKGRTSARYNIWVRGPGLTSAIGNIKCNSSSRPFGKRKHYRSKTDGPDKHIWLRSLRMSSRTRAKECKATFTSLKGTGPFEVVVTRSSRPSDWF